MESQSFEIKWFLINILIWLMFHETRIFLLYNKKGFVLSAYLVYLSSIKKTGEMFSEK